MAKRLYTKKLLKHPIRGLVTGVAGLVLAGFLVWFWEPSIWWREMVVLVIGLLSLTVVNAWIFKNLKTGWVISGGVFGLLILNRLEVLDLVSAALLILVLLLIALVN